MAEEQTEQAKREFGIQKIYTKDVSFETPNSPEIFKAEWKPDVNLQLGHSTKPIGENVHEVILSITITAKVNKKTAYLAEVNQAGIFSLSGYNEQEMGAMMGVYCPNILFPYAREAISELVAKGGFPQMLMAPVNFDALYQQHLQQQTQAKTEKVTH